MILTDRNRRSKFCAQLLCVGLLFSIALSSIAATDTAPSPQANALDLGALTRDLTLTRNVDPRLSIIMWMPDEFWRASLQSSGRMTEQGIAQFLAITHPYIMVSVLDAQRGITAFRYTELDSLLSDVKIEDAHGTFYSPVSPDSVTDEMKNMLRIYRPILSSMMGAMGQHMEILLFPSLDKSGSLIADPTKDGSLTVHLNDIAMHYRLPLGSVLPPSMDAKTGESFPGSYHFNPYTGTKLVPQTPGARAEAEKKTE